MLKLWGNIIRMIYDPEELCPECGGLLGRDIWAIGTKVRCRDCFLRRRPTPPRLWDTSEKDNPLASESPGGEAAPVP